MSPQVVIDQVGVPRLALHVRVVGLPDRVFVAVSEPGIPWGVVLLSYIASLGPFVAGMIAVPSSSAAR